MKVKDNFSRFQSLREKYPRLHYDSYDFHFSDNKLIISFKFRIEGLKTFQPVITIPWAKNYFREREYLSLAVLDTLVFHIGMIELISYWKSSCSPSVILPDGKISYGQLAFWKKLYFNGLGEFFYTNGIQTSEENFMQIEGAVPTAHAASELELTGPPLVPVGGGKDSAVSMGLINRSGNQWIPLAINPIRAALDTVAAAGKNPDDILVIQRQIDPGLMELNEQGFLNGHTPFSAIVAFYGVLAAYLTGSRDIILSNESSANEATIPGTKINHQYSKTFEFEKDFREYISTYISPSFNYFSLLRPLTELQIAKRFSGFPEYFPVFRSCNVGSKKGIWCGNCPKCLFTWIILSPFLSQDKLKEVFGKDLLANPDLASSLDELSGFSAIKPFECVGTIDEVTLSLDWLTANYPTSPLPFLLEHYVSRKNGIKNEEIMLKDSLQGLGKNHFVPSEYLQLLEHE